MLHEVVRRGSGRSQVDIASVQGGGELTTRDIPLPLVRNLMALHESASPDSVKGFANSVYRAGLMEEFLSEAVSPTHSSSSPRDPARLKEAFYAASFLQNDEARECLVYSEEGRVVGMAQIGKFAPDIPGLSCTIGNLVLSPKLDASSQTSIIRHMASAAKDRFGEATLITPEPWGSAYRSHGFHVEKPPSTSRNAEAGKSYMVRCRWEA